jgi:Na+-transporting NADH:ubiquinone oxidoreductase subunit E
MAIGFMSFGGMLTGGDEKEETTTASIEVVTPSEEITNTEDVETVIDSTATINEPKIIE